MTYTMTLGDCLFHMRAMEDKSIDLVLADPPYESTMHDAKASAARNLRTDGGPELQALGFEAINEVRFEVAREMVRLCRGWVLVFCTPEGIAPWRDAFEAAGAKYKRACFWHKPDAAPQFNGQGPAFAVEPFVAVWCGKGHSRWNGGGGRNLFECRTNGPWRDGRHPTEKPWPLMQRLVELFSKRGDLVLDPFAGTGATGIGALRAGRRFCGFEINEDWHGVALSRLSEAASVSGRQGALDLVAGAS